MSAKFGPAGNSDAFSAVHKSSLAAPQWIAEQGLDCYEYQCGKGCLLYTSPSPRDRG